MLTARNAGLSQAKLGTLRKEVRLRVEPFSKCLTSALNAKEPRIPIRESVKALHDLHQGGFYILHTLFGEERRKLFQLRELAREACPAWANPGWNGTAPRPSLIVVSTSVDNGIPIDLLPILDFEPGRPSDLREDLGRLACSFLGFSAVVKRQIGTTIVDSEPLENIPKLPMKLFMHRGLQCARQEEAVLTKNGNLDAEAAWPDGKDPPQDEFPEMLARYLLEVDSRFGRGPRKIPDQICHFSCHSNTGLDLLPSEYAIHLQSGRYSGRRSVTLQALTNALFRLEENIGEVRRSRPLIFLNSCGSSDLDPAGSGSFPELFLKRDHGFKGFIGTETSMPDDFAAKFSEYFYENLLGGYSLGHALWQTRWQLLSLYQNPLGLLYTLFAEPEIRVRKPVLANSLDTGNRGARATLGVFARLKRALTPKWRV